MLPNVKYTKIFESRGSPQILLESFSARTIHHRYININLITQNR